jgi:hypothetical protein
MVRYGYDFHDGALRAIDDAEWEAMEKVASKLVLKRRPALRAFSDVLHRNVQLVQKGVREGGIALKVPSASCLGFIRSKRMESNRGFSHAERARGAASLRPKECFVPRRNRAPGRDG